MANKKSRSTLIAPVPAPGKKRITMIAHTPIGNFSSVTSEIDAADEVFLDKTIEMLREKSDWLTFESGQSTYIIKQETLQNSVIEVIIS